MLPRGWKRTLPRKWGKLPHAWSSLSSSLGVDGSRLKGKGKPTSQDNLPRFYDLGPPASTCNHATKVSQALVLLGAVVNRYTCTPLQRWKRIQIKCIHTVCKHPFYLRQGPHPSAPSLCAPTAHWLMTATASRVHRHRGAPLKPHTKRLESGAHQGTLSSRALATV